MAPGRSRRPWHFGLWAGLAWRMVERKQLGMAAFLLMALSPYCRPSELVSLRRSNLQPPSPGVSEFWRLLLYPEGEVARSKTGLCDISIPMESEHLRFLEPTYR
eukprot:4432738-Alexandrium_andersonii.AAC.1